MLEVLIALFILAIGLLGVVALQAESIKLNQQAYSSTQALFLANEMAERMRANKKVFSPNANGDGIDDVSSWKQDVKSRLSGGVGTITPQGNNLFHISIQYNQQTLNNEGIEGGESGIKEVDYLLTVVL